MTLIDLDKFIASFITAMKEYNPRIMSIPACIKQALYKQGLTYHDGQIVKNQIRISAEAKETGYSESEDEKIRKEIKQLIQGMHDADPRKERWLTWLEKQGDINRRIQEEVEKQTRQQWKPEIQGDNVSGECNDTALEEQLKIWFEKGKCSGIDDVIFHPQKYGLEKQGEQKHAEWSVEDDNHLHSIYHYLRILKDESDNDSVKKNIEEHINWLSKQYQIFLASHFQ